MIDRAREVLKKEIEAISNIPICANIEEAVKVISSCRGKVVFCGMGKAGLVAKKISATFSSTGTPSIFLHPGEAQHGDLGVIGDGDILVAISNSGKTREVIETMLLSKRIGNNYIISITSNLESRLANISDLSLSIGKTSEAGPFGLVPTSSTTAMMVLGDILCVLTMEEKSFTKEEYSKRHHGGYIGVQARGDIDEKQ
jgi:arabinose-5-phosphate isomerase